MGTVRIDPASTPRVAAALRPATAPLESAPWSPRFSQHATPCASLPKPGWRRRSY